MKEIEELIVLVYSNVSVGSKSLRRKILNDTSLQDLVRGIKYNLSVIKIRLQKLEKNISQYGSFENGI